MKAEVVFPEGVYSDVRYERVWATSVVVRDGERENVSRSQTVGAFLRVYHAGRWVTASTTNLGSLSEQLAEMARGASGAPNLSVHTDVVRPFDDELIDTIGLAEKMELLESGLGPFQHESMRTWYAEYVDERIDKLFVSSAGAHIETSTQRCGMSYKFTVGQGDDFFVDRTQAGSDRFSELPRGDAHVQQAVELSLRFLNAEPVVPGVYPVVLSPATAGVFAHESFGHKSEADFMLGDPSMLESWKLGKQVGAPILTIVDDGQLPGSGFTPYDDEGQPAKRTSLIAEGELAGRLHSGSTAEALNEERTGNARAMSFRFDPIVRMTTTYIGAGNTSKEEVFAGVEDGFYIESFGHGSGMSTFTIAPVRAYRIRGGKVAEPVRIAVISGSVFETLSLIEAVSDTVELMPTVTGGCGKFEQWPLPVAFGGPFVRVSKMQVA